MVALSVLSQRRVEVGLVAGDLRPCPDSPNCVSSRASDELHRVGPLYRGSDPGRAWKALERILTERKNVRLRVEETSYLYAEFVTPLLRFVDDVEFLLDRRRGELHVRSASRVGWWDLGANRRRVEALRSSLEGELGR